ncbi:hypothetical protein FRX31_003516 [Thalictrum thalictroides]|uniref:Uncharacterized protein n=1 Tax=Thalictrum thalictroides TaxID=46969 RepID=A0A7J6XD72_THATH|nr:hypothetical protein FRX31_003516 [Thalictrum thalictroides]
MLETAFIFSIIRCVLHLLRCSSLRISFPLKHHRSESQLQRCDSIRICYLFGNKEMLVEETKNGGWICSDLIGSDTSCVGFIDGFMCISFRMV